MTNLVYVIIILVTVTAQFSIVLRRIEDVETRLIRMIKENHL